MCALPSNDDSINYDLAIIGAGPGGYSAALRAASLGLRVALIDSNPHPGGTCVHRGCIPTKALMQVTHAIEHITEAQRFGITAEITKIDYGAMHNYVRMMVLETSQGLAGLLAFRKVHYIVGRAAVCQIDQPAPDGARFAITITPVLSNSDESASTNSQDMAGQPDSAQQQTSTQHITARRVILALGAHAQQLVVQGKPVAWSQSVLNSDGALALNDFPRSAVIIGSGVIATEFASLWNQAGVDVTMIVRGSGVLTHGDRRVSTVLTRELRRQGIRIITQSQVEDITTGVNLGVRVQVGSSMLADAQTDTSTTATQSQSSSAQPAAQFVEAQIALVAIGRRARTQADWITHLGITDSSTSGGNSPILVNEHYQTAIPGLFAIGDCIGGSQLAHRSFAQGIATAEYIAGVSQEIVDETSIPRVVFSTPEVASVGLTREQALQDAHYEQVQETIYPMTANARTHMLGMTGSISVVSACKQDQSAESTSQPQVVGIHMVGPQVSEFAAEAQQIVGNALSVHDAARFIHPHPTFSEALGEALLKADQRPLHMR